MFILPGTHSKHMMSEDGMLIDFQTWMTGELFEIISTNSILNNSIQKGGFDLAAKRHLMKECILL